MKSPCPVCGYLLSEPACDYNICPSCGTEFEYHDAGRSHAELRQAWIARGAPWSSRHVAPPLNWNPLRQLGLSYSVSPAGQEKSQLGTWPVQIADSDKKQENTVLVPCA